MRWYPARVLPGQADDQLLQLLVERGSPGSAVRVGPGAGDQPPVPAQQRLRPDEEARPAGSGQRTADGGEHSAVGRFESGSWGLAAQHSRAGDGAPGSPSPWQHHRGPAAPAAGWSGTGSGRRGSTARSGPPSRRWRRHTTAPHMVRTASSQALTEFAHPTGCGWSRGRSGLGCGCGRSPSCWRSSTGASALVATPRRCCASGWPRSTPSLPALGRCGEADPAARPAPEQACTAETAEGSWCVQAFSDQGGDGDGGVPELRLPCGERPCPCCGAP
jgi:hypothetical protein